MPVAVPHRATARRGPHCIMASPGEVNSPGEKFSGAIAPPNLRRTSGGPPRVPSHEAEPQARAEWQEERKGNKI